MFHFKYDIWYCFYIIYKNSNLRYVDYKFSLFFHIFFMSYIKQNKKKWLKN